jgi:hypothetical protein
MGRGRELPHCPIPDDDFVGLPLRSELLGLHQGAVPQGRFVPDMLWAGRPGWLLELSITPRATRCH